MSRELKITLSDEQCDALAVEAKQNGLKFFDHCRTKLAAGLESAPLERAPVAKPVQSTAMKPAGAQPDRLDRLEAMMLQLADAVQGGALAKPVPEPVEYHGPEIDVADVIGDALGEADRQGLTAIVREAPVVQHGVRHVGTRPPSRYSVTPRHLQGVLPG